MLNNKDKKEEPNKVPVNWAKKSQKLWDETYQAWQSKHFDWFKYKSFFDGQHYLGYDTRTGELKNYNSDGKGVTIPLCGMYIQAMVNHLMRDTFRWQFEPDDLSPESEKRTLALGKLMDKYWEVLGMDELLREGLVPSQLYSASVFFIGWDDRKNDGKGDITIKHESEYTVLPDPTACDMQSCRYMLRKVKRTLDSVRNDEHYNKDFTKLLLPQKAIGATPISEQIFTQASKVSDTQVGNDLEMGECYVIELYLREYVEEEYTDAVTKEMKQRKSPRIRLVCSSQGYELYNEITDLEDFPFEFLYSDKDPMSMYGNGSMKKLIPLNQVINKYETQKLEYLDRIARGRFFIRKGDKITPGQVDGMSVMYFDGKNYTDGRMAMQQMEMPALPSTIENSLQNFKGWIQDVAGIADVMMGKSPGANIANSAIENLIAQGANSSVQFQKNLQDFLERVARKILWNVAKHQITPRQFIVKNESGDNEVLSFISDESDLGLQTQDNQSEPSDMLRVGAVNNVRVETVSRLAYTDQGKQEILEKLYTLRDADGQPLLPEEDVLEGYKFGNIKDIVERRNKIKEDMRAQKEKEQGLEVQMQQMKQQHEQEMEAIRERAESNIPYDNAPEDIKRQMEVDAGFKPSEEVVLDATSVKDPVADYGRNVLLRQTISKMLKPKEMGEKTADMETKAESMKE